MAFAAAGNIDEAIQFTRQNVWTAHIGAAENLRARSDTWNTTVFAIFTDSDAERVVRDWYPISERQANRITSGAATSTDDNADEMTDVVYRTLLAVRFGVIDGNITAAQQTLVVAAFNTAWT
jgi:hypothetical protein